MPQFAPVSPERHAGKVWQRRSNFAFAAAEPLVTLAGVDLVQAALTGPIAFVARDGSYAPVMVMSPTPGHNLFVGPDGQWLGGYTPADLQAYPFRMLPQAGTDQMMLCVDEGSGLVLEAGALSGAERFFAEDGALSAALKAIVDFLTEVERSRVAVIQASALLAQAGVISPWNIKLKTGEAERTAEGLFRIDEAALGALTDARFLALRPALPLVYAQLLSTAQLGVFQKLMTWRESLQKQVRPSPSALVASLLQEQDDGLLKFD